MGWGVDWLNNVQEAANFRSLGGTLSQIAVPAGNIERRTGANRSCQGSNVLREGDYLQVAKREVEINCERPALGVPVLPGLEVPKCQCNGLYRQLS